MNFMHYLIILVVIILGISDELKADVIGFGTSKPGSVNYTAGSILSQLLSEKTSYTARAIPHSGTATTIYTLNAGEVDFAVSNLLEAVLARQGESFYTQGKQTDISLVGTLFELPVAFFVRKDSNFNSISDLKGARVPAKYTSQPIFEILQEALLANGNLGYEDINIVPVSNGIQAADQFAANRLDTFFYSLSAGKVREISASVGELRALPLDHAHSAMNRLKKYMPVAFASEVGPERNIPGISQKTYVMAYDYVILSSSKTSDDVVYQLTKLVYENENIVKEKGGPLRGFQKNNMLKKWDNINYHPGAIKYYREIGIWPAQ
ncbi:MAG: TRAP transporter TAXI family solute receptor [Gammaproteobacteria bacterium]|jgi:TRAP transporter TAXI family solute receptor